LQKPMTVVIGVGNAHRGDDAAGIAAARRLAELASDRAVILTETNDAARLVESWKGADAAIILDAVCSGARPGTIHRFDARKRPIPRALLRYSTHGFSVADAIELARALDTLPPRVTVYGIEGSDFQAGAGLSPDVEKAVKRVVEVVLVELRSEE